MSTLVTTQPAVQSTAAMSSTVVQNDTFSLSGASVTVQDTGTVIKSSKSAAAVLNDLIAEKDAWFTNAYKTSNDQLYALLAKCYGLYLQLQGATEDAAKLRKELAAYVSEKYPSLPKSSHTLSKIVKCVFGADRRRVSAYSIVLRTALAKELKVEAIADFIRESGGVEEVRLAKSPNAMTAKQKAEAGASTLASKTIVNVTAPAFKEALDAGNIGKPVVLIGTWNADGSISVHSYSNGATVVNAALVAQFAQVKSAADSKKAETKAANDSQVAKDAVTQAVDEATALPLAA
jgi:hypothetical protein